MKILTTLLDIVTVFLSLLQAEGRILKRAVMNVAWTLAFVGIATLLVLAAVGFPGGDLPVPCCTYWCGILYKVSQQRGFRIHQKPFETEELVTLMRAAFGQTEDGRS
jgi:hypothetical protein